MKLKNLFKILAIVTLSLTVASPVCAAPGEVTQSADSTVLYTVAGLVRPGETQVKAIVEEKLLSHCNVGFRGESYTEQQWCSFLLEIYL